MYCLGNTQLAAAYIRPCYRVPSCPDLQAFFDCSHLSNLEGQRRQGVLILCWNGLHAPLQGLQGHLPPTEPSGQTVYKFGVLR